MPLNTLEQNISMLKKERQSIIYQIVTTVIMDNIVKTVEKFLTFSEEKLEELSQKNQELREGKKIQKGRIDEEILSIYCCYRLSFCSNIVISTEKDIPLTTSQQYELTNTSYSNYYQTLPTNPNVY